MKPEFTSLHTQRQSLQIPADLTAQWTCIDAIDMHTGGEPLRIILDGFPPLEGGSVLAKRRFALHHYDHLRRTLMWEPRGHRDMYGAIVVPPNDAGADFGALFIHNEGFSSMCGHAVIALAKLAVELGWIERGQPGTEVPVNIDVPCGRIHAFAQTDQHGRVCSTRFHCVPSFVVAQAQTVQVPELGAIQYDIAYGGAFYAYVDAAQLPFSLDGVNAGQLVRVGQAIKHAVQADGPLIQHPIEPDLGFLYGTILMDMEAFQDPHSYGDTVNPSIYSRNVCIFADAELDRSPTGSGVAGRMALHVNQGLISENHTLVAESITGSCFSGRVARRLKYAGIPAIVPEITGTAHITGQHRFYIDPADPLKNGFLLG
ncbi:proline racemase family protein [Microbulbifer spongiae]|uniref:Proline racemase family protein n=1 Tax=Microbulbifer spongiae TaxID=2944933 RepID=A0ABY9E535_9GAMM|nr:proline racemase family protein [Microbulbifer sp. MI-G]WKD48143.1 proline racemase family protein [Microbulbifer sp. MI-G]